MSRMSRVIIRCGVAAALVALAGCASQTRAPVESRKPEPTRPAPAAQTPEATPAMPRPGYHTVKKGDTLLSISLEHGQDWREVAAWNGLENPNLILVGQELRVKPPEAGASRDGNGSAPGIEVRALEPRPDARPPAETSARNDEVRREPRGGKVAYSDAALAAAMQADVAATAPRPESKPEAKPVEPPRKESAPEAKPPSGDDELEWAWPAAGKVVGAFSESTNKGIDIGGQPGEVVTAAGAGKVVYAGSALRGYGNLVIIKHNANYLSAYAHNQEVLVKEGQSVKRGQKIALLGDSDADRPKLHFEIRRMGKPVDPLKYLPKR